MDISIVSKTRRLNVADEEFTRYRLAFSLYQERELIDEVQVHLHEIAGFDLEYLYRCVIEVHLIDGHSVTGDGTACDLHLAIHRAVERTESLVTSCITGLDAIRHRNPGDFDTSRHLASDDRSDLGQLS